MEVMAKPSKETLEFHAKVINYIKSRNVNEDGVEFVFKKNTPDYIITLFEDIKNKLKFKVRGYSIEI